MTGTSQVMHDDVINERFIRVWDRFAALEKASTKADEVFEVYRASSNEFRGALSDQASHLLPRAEYNTAHTVVVEQLNSLESRVLQNSAAQMGRNSGISAIGYTVISVIGAFVGLSSITSAIVMLLHR